MCARYWWVAHHDDVGVALVEESVNVVGKNLKGRKVCSRISLWAAYSVSQEVEVKVKVKMRLYSSHDQLEELSVARRGMDSIIISTYTMFWVITTVL